MYFQVLRTDQVKEFVICGAFVIFWCNGIIVTVCNMYHGGSHDSQPDIVAEAP